MNPNYSKAIPKEWDLMAKVFEALGHEQRQRILLTFEKGEELNIRDIVSVSSLQRTSVVHHLQILENSGVLEARKKGKFVYYNINPNVVIDACTHLIDYAEKMK